MYHININKSVMHIGITVITIMINVFGERVFIAIITENHRWFGTSSPKCSFFYSHANRSYDLCALVIKKKIPVLYFKLFYRLFFYILMLCGNRTHFWHDESQIEPEHMKLPNKSLRFYSHRARPVSLFEIINFIC